MLKSKKWVTSDMQYFLNWAALSDLWTTRAIRYMRQCSATKHPSAKLFMGDVQISVFSRQTVAPILTLYTWIKIICTWLYGFLIVTLFSIILFSLSVVDLGIGTTCVNARNMSKMAHIQENKHLKVISSNNRLLSLNWVLEGVSDAKDCGKSLVTE